MKQNKQFLSNLYVSLPCNGGKKVPKVRIKGGGGGGVKTQHFQYG